MSFFKKLLNSLGFGEKPRDNDMNAAASRTRYVCRQVGGAYYCYRIEGGHEVECGGPYIDAQKCEAVASQYNGE